ncbi:MAG TPA: DHA2 family efflux MFS transporter permease subunit [Fimbriimonadaceae bacterium]|nr:DHA2 family efflux MFS transporter permease subunit [Fimbriimonadaceae bacterium]
MSSAAATNSSGYTDAGQADVMRYRWLILIGLITAAIMEVLDTTIVNVALPQMAGNLGATFTEIAWVSTGYILSNVVILPMTAFFTGVFGRQRYLCGSILLFIIASFFCGTSHTLGELVLWRVVQGMGGAALLSTAQATLRQIFPKEQQGLVQALFVLGIIVAPTLGPTLGGWITDNYTWSWCFFINVPIGVVSFFLVSTFLHDPPGMRTTNVKVDLFGIGLLAVGLASLQYVLEEGNQNDWFNDPLIVRLTVISVVCLSVMLWWELSPRNKDPVVDFRILKNGSLSASIFLFVSLGFGLYGGTYLFPLFTQTLLGFSPTQTGLALLPGGIATGATALICGRLLNGPRAVIDPRVLIFFGMGIFITAMWTLAHLSTNAGEPETRSALIIRGLGLGFLFIPINNVAYGSIDPRQAQQASGLINLSRQLGGSFGIAILGTYLTRQIQVEHAHLTSYTYKENPLLAQRVAGMTQYLVQHGKSHAAAGKAALFELDAMVSRQGAMLAYNSSWMLLLVSFLVVSPAILLLRARRSAVSMEAH